MRLLFCTYAIDNGVAGRSLFVLARQLARMTQNFAVFELAGRKAAAATKAFFHPARNAAGIGHLLTKQDLGHA